MRLQVGGRPRRTYSNRSGGGVVDRQKFSATFELTLLFLSLSLLSLPISVYFPVLRSGSLRRFFKKILYICNGKLVQLAYTMEKYEAFYVFYCTLTDFIKTFRNCNLGFEVFSVCLFEQRPTIGRIYYFRRYPRRRKPTTIIDCCHSFSPFSAFFRTMRWYVRFYFA